MVGVHYFEEVGAFEKLVGGVVVEEEPQRVVGFLDDGEDSQVLEFLGVGVEGVDGHWGELEDLGVLGGFVFCHW